jgi:PAS domain S-box-containing protein
MDYEGKERIDLIKELNKLRSRVMDLEETELKRKQIEDALRESETQLRVVLNSLGDAIHVLNKDLRMLMMNTSFQRWNLELGLKVDVIGKKVLDVFPFLPETVIEEYQRVIDNGETLITEEKTIINGREFITETRKIPIYENGEVTKVITIVRDITQRKLSDVALKESEQRFRGLAEESFDMIFIIDINGDLSYISPSVKKITGYTREEVLGKSLEKFLPKSQLNRLKQASDRLMKGETIQGLDLEILGRKKNSVFIEINAAPMFSDVKVVGYQGIARDITERKRTEEEMKKRLMKFKLDPGKVYLIGETSNTISREVLKDLERVGYKGIFISRTYESHYKSNNGGSFKFYWLSENGQKNAIKPNLNQIIQKVSKLPHKKVIYINRLDYLISKHNFKKVLTFIQNLHELAIFSNHIIILSVDPSILTNREQKLLEKETTEIEPLFKPKLPDDLISVLKFIYEENTAGIKPSYSQVEHELRVCKPTMRKRIRKLISGGYLIDNKNGRRKVVELTERGKNFFNL